MWILLTQIGSLTDATKNIFLKSVPKEVDSILVNWIWLMFTILVLLPLGLWNGIPQLDTTFWLITGLRMIIDPIAIFLFTQSMRKAEVSLVLPLLSLGPVFTMFSSYFINHEVPNLFGLCGFILILSGMYFLNFTRENGFLAPFKHLFNSQASVYMLTASVLWGVQSSFLKLALATVPAAFFTLVGTIGIFLIFSVIVFAKYRHQVKLVLTKENLKLLSIVGILDGLTVYFRMIALAGGLAAYVSALNRTTIIFSSIFGYIFFKEHLGKRIVPITVMLIGVLLVTLG